jgi:hypothetical protein
MRQRKILTSPLNQTNGLSLIAVRSHLMSILTLQQGRRSGHFGSGRKRDPNQTQHKTESAEKNGLFRASVTFREFRGFSPDPGDQKI